MATGGPIESVTLDGREFAVASDADAGRNLGGFTNEVQSNGNGTARNIKTRVPWSVSGLALEIDDFRGDQEFLQAIADNPDYVPMLVTFVSSAVYEGTGTITGDIVMQSATTTAAVDLGGPLNLTRQV